jgi:hypothetical protein
MKQNTSHAVMARRFEPMHSADDFPTPPWATRALFEFVLGEHVPLRRMSCLEPACGAGHMAAALEEQFESVAASDAYDYGYGEVRDFLLEPYRTGSYDWVITNPPFRLAQEFVIKGLEVARIGVAIVARTTFLESVGRYEAIFRGKPLAIFAQFTERVPMLKGRLDPRASTATGYAWFVWRKGTSAVPQLVWVPPCRKALERPEDYHGTPADRPARTSPLQPDRADAAGTHERPRMPLFDWVADQRVFLSTL